MGKWFIYLLKDPRTAAVRYVGKTTNPKARLKTHIQQAKKCFSDCYKDKWLRSLLALSLRPVMEVIEEGHGEGWQAAEQKWIAHYKALAKLTNGTDGGDGGNGAVWSDEARARLSKALTGLKRSPEGRASIAAANRRRKWTAEQRIAIGTANRKRWLGARHTPATRAKMTASGKANWSKRRAVRYVGQGRLFE